MGPGSLEGGVPALAARGVSKTYDRIEHVLEGVDLAVDPGEVVVVMGRSGSGKTTLLNILAGLETPTEGRVLVGDEEMTALDEEARTRLRREEVGVVFQRFHLIPELSVLENVRLPMRLAGRDGATERARELLGFFGLDHRVDAYPSTLSGGETQRAAIARALGNEPAVVLADEPTANLDEGNAKNALSALRQVADKLDTAVLIATHDPLGKHSGDRVLDLADGVLHPDASTTKGPVGTTGSKPSEGGEDSAPGASDSGSSDQRNEPSNSGARTERRTGQTSGAGPEPVEEVEAEPVFEEVGERDET